VPWFLLCGEGYEQRRKLETELFIFFNNSMLHAIIGGCHPLPVFVFFPTFNNKYITAEIAIDPAMINGTAFINLR
jgi:hypothetical protein